MGARERVLEVLAVAKRIADPKDKLGKEARARLVATTKLSRAGVELALRDHLETKASDDDLESLLASVGSAPRTVVVLSANVCVAAVRAIAIARATSEDVVVKPSRRDPVLAEILARELDGVTLVASIEGSVRAGDEAHLYGRDASLATIEASLPKGAIVRAHGAGFGIAIYDFDVGLDMVSVLIARDVMAFDQAGCLSPRIVLAASPKTAGMIARALRAAEKLVPRGDVSELEPEIARYAYVMQAVGSVERAKASLVGLDPTPRALLLPPPARVVHVAVVNPDNAAKLVAPFAHAVASIGVEEGSSIFEAVADLVPDARVSPLGRMQRPPLDGPVDRRTVARTR